MAGIAGAYLLDRLNTPADNSPSTSNRYLNLDRSLQDDGSDADPSLRDVPEPDLPKVAIVIDDLGWSREPVSAYESVNHPLTFAVLPDRPFSQSIYDQWKDRFEFLVHLPMEPVGYPEDDPGRMALMTSMSPGEVSDRLREILERFPQVTGVNNHMGSQFTQNRQLMDVVMGVLKRKDMFYLDSRTSSNSVALSVAKSRDVPVLRNQVFLDNRRTPESIRGQFKKLIRLARQDGSAVGIGHFQSVATARVLADQMPKYHGKEVTFVSVSDLIWSGGNGSTGWKPAKETIREERRNRL